MLHKSWTLVPITLIAAISFVGCGRHGYFHRFHRNVPDMIVKHISKELDLNDAQKTKLKALVAEIQAKHEELRTGKAEQVEQFTNEIRKDTLDLDRINQLIDEKHEAMAEMRPFMIEKLTEFHAMLTPEQRNKLADKMEAFHKEHSK